MSSSSSSSDAEIPAYESGYEDAKMLREAMEGLGTDEDSIIELTVTRTHRRRIETVKAYAQAFGRNLVEDLRSETSGDFGRLLTCLYKPLREVDAYHLRKAMSGAGTDEKVLYEILCSRNCSQLTGIHLAYEKMFERNLTEDLRGELSGDLKRFLVAQSNTHRDEDGKEVDDEVARAEAIELFEAGELRWGTDESTFIRILSTRNRRQLRKTFRNYEEISGKTIAESIKSEFSGHVADALVSFCTVVTEGKNKFYAGLLHAAMKGLGTDDSTLIRVISERAHFGKRIRRLQEVYAEVYGVELTEEIESETSGDYRKLLLAILARNRS